MVTYKLFAYKLFVFVYIYIYIYLNILQGVQNLLSYLPNPSAQAGYDTRSIFYAEFNRFEFRVFLLLD